MRSMHDIDLRGKVVLIREDFNVPMQSGKITHTTRIDCALPTIQQALAQGAKIILMSHLGRPKAGVFDAEFSLAPIASYLSEVLKQPVSLFQLGDTIPWQQSNVVLLENVRFLAGEEENSPELSQKLAALGDIYVMDAFACAHRAQSSTCGIIDYVAVACAGPLLLKELNAIAKVLKAPQKPVLAIVGGSKISTKLHVLTNVLDKVDTLVLGGGIANTFLAAQGQSIGASLYEPECVAIAKDMLTKAQQLGKTIWLPTDVIVAESMDASGQVKSLNDVTSTDKIFDIGPKSSQALKAVVQQAQTILWNGPVGVFEKPAFAEGTNALAQAIAQSSGYSLAGGGDTLAAIEQFGVSEKISYLSTGGGAFLEMLEGKILPAVAALEKVGHKAASI